MKLTAESTVINDSKLNTNINNAQNTADTAKNIADNTAQYFWFTSEGTDTGAHISEKTQAQFLASPSGGNLLARSNGIAVRDGLTELATFGAANARIGINTEAHISLYPNELDMIDSNGNNGFRVVDSGSSARILKTVHVHQMVATNAIYILTLPLCISGTAIKVILYEYDNDGAYAEEEINLTAGTTSSGSNAACTYSYNGSTRALTITANSSDPFIEISTYQCYPTITETIAQVPGELSVKKIRCNDYDMVDFVAQQGTSGIWTYRVWESGIKECWGIYTASIAVNTSAAAYGGYRSAQISMPAFPIVFTDPPVITATAGSATGFWVNNIVPSSTGGKFYLSAGASLAAANRSINFHVIGK